MRTIPASIEMQVQVFDDASWPVLRNVYGLPPDLGPGDGLVRCLVRVGGGASLTAVSVFPVLASHLALGDAWLRARYLFGAWEKAKQDFREQYGIQIVPERVP